MTLFWRVLCACIIYSYWCVGRWSSLLFFEKVLEVGFFTIGRKRTKENKSVLIVTIIHQSTRIRWATKEIIKYFVCFTFWTWQTHTDTFSLCDCIMIMACCSTADGDNGDRIKIKQKICKFYKSFCYCCNRKWSCNDWLDLVGYLLVS